MTQSRVIAVTIADADERSASPPTRRWRAADCRSVRRSEPARAGPGRWRSTATGSSCQPGAGPRAIARTHVGEHLGTVMVAEDFPSVWERLRGASSYLLTYLGIALALGRGRLVVARPPDQAPDPRARAARDHRPGRAPRGPALRHRRRRVALDPHQRITLVNDVARRLLDLPEHAAGMSLRRPARRGPPARRPHRRPARTDGDDDDEDDRRPRRGRHPPRTRAGDEPDARGTDGGTSAR